MSTRKYFTAEFKAKVAMAAYKGDKTIAELSSEYGVHSSQIAEWKKQLAAGAPGLFTTKKDKKTEELEDLVDDLYKNIGKTQAENNWLKKKMDQLERM